MNGAKWMYNVLSLLGIAVSLYSLYVEHHKEADESYEAFCDISPSVSCSAVISSE